MPDTIQSFLIGGVAGVVSAILTHLSTRAKIRLDLAAEYDKKLQEERLAAYKQLWTYFEKIAKYGRDAPITYNVLREISNKTRTWYFQTGGIYLTQTSRTPYFDWKTELQKFLDDPNLAQTPDAEIADETIQDVIDLASALRTHLSDDIGTKRLSRV